MVAGQKSRGGYGVKLVRGPFIRLAPHADHCESPEAFVKYAAKLRRAGRPLAVDLFCGAGGLSLGLREAGFEVALSADKDPEALETHRHQFGGLCVDWDLGDPEQVARIGELVRAAKVDLVAGGPPCQPFSKAGRSMARHRIRNGHRDPNHERRDLWRSFLEIIRLSMPRAVLMENVPDMALDREMFILRSMVEELELLGYSVEERVVETWRYGVPQFRQRLILVALRDGVAFHWPDPDEGQVNVWNAIGDLPEVQGGWRPDGGAAGWTEYSGPNTEFQRSMRAAVPADDANKLYDHITRPVRPDDALAFEYMTSEMRYSDLPEEFKRYRDDIFDDKYKRLDGNDLSRTITAHIAKDGYWYIHPKQNRTLTVREAARLQTFPDWYRFAGPPSAAFRQIGNAVPPRLGERLGRAILVSLDKRDTEATTTRETAATLAEWFRTTPSVSLPWLRATTRWQVIAAEMLLDKSPTDHIRHIWPVVAMLGAPGTADDPAYEVLADMIKSVGRGHRLEQVEKIGRHLVSFPDLIDSDDLKGGVVPGLSDAVADIAVLAVATGDADESEEPVLATKGVLRVAGRYFGEDVNRRNRLSDGRMAVARMIGGGTAARDAHKGLIELANTICRPLDPACGQCPLTQQCQKYEVYPEPTAALF